MLHEDEFVVGDPKKGRIFNNDFIGPSSYTLQMQNIIAINENTNTPNIRKDYVVTDKADGERHLLYISDVGKMYLIKGFPVFPGDQTRSGSPGIRPSHWI